MDSRRSPVLQRSMVLLVACLVSVREFDRKLGLSTGREIFR